VARGLVALSLRLHLADAFLRIYRPGGRCGVAAGARGRLVAARQARPDDAGIGLAAGAVLTYVPWQYDHRLKTLPRIHDITTDPENPPTYVAALPAREVENAAPATYAEPEIASQQRAAYPDLAPFKVGLPPEQVFPRALDTAKAMPGWSVVSADPAAGRIEARQTSLWFRFTDDIVIRVAADTSGSRVDMRSESRQGRSDFGVNASRVRAYMARLKQQLG
jgi:uncharacterized protein (DUF1499 family)